MRNTLLRALVILFILQIAPHRAQAQDAKAIHPDWTGYYRLATAKQLGGTGFKQDAPGEELNALITPYLQPWAKARMEATDGIADDTGQVCLPDGIFRYPSMGGNFSLAAGARTHCARLREYQYRGREAHLYGSSASQKSGAELKRSLHRRWEGDALIVDTIGFNDKSWLFGGMQPHTEEAHLIERVPQVGNGAFLEDTSLWRTATRSRPPTGTNAITEKNRTTRCRSSFAMKTPTRGSTFAIRALQKHLDDAKQVK